MVVTKKRVLTFADLPCINLLFYDKWGWGFSPYCVWMCGEISHVVYILNSSCFEYHKAKELYKFRYLAAIANTIFHCTQ